MAIKFNGASLLRLMAPVVTNYPFSMSIWVSTDTATECFAFAQQTGNIDRAASLYMLGNGVVELAHLRNTGNGTSAQHNFPQSATAKLAVLVFESASSRSLYFGSNVPATSTAAMVNDIALHDRVTIGGADYNNAGPSLFLNGTAAEPHFYNTALTVAQIDALLADTVKPEATAGWVDGWMLKDVTDLTSIGGTRTLTVVGTIANKGSHPINRATPPANINLSISNLASAGTLSTVSVGVTPPQAGVVNLAISNMDSAGSLTTVVVGVTQVQGTITSDEFTAFGNQAPLANLTVPHVTVTRMTDRVQVLSLANQVTNGAGRLVLVSPSIVSGVWYMLASWNTDGTLRGFKAHLAA